MSKQETDQFYEDIMKEAERQREPRQTDKERFADQRKQEQIRKTAKGY